MAKRSRNPPATDARTILDQHRLPITPETKRLLSRLNNKTSLCQTALSWLDPDTHHLYRPNLQDPEDDADSDDEDSNRISLEEAAEAYRDFLDRPQVRAKEVLQRIIDYEFRDGLTLRAIADLETQYLLSHPTSLKWSTFHLTPLSTGPSTRSPPRFHPATFSSTLTASLTPLSITPHIAATQHPSLPLTLMHITLLPTSALYSSPQSGSPLQPPPSFFLALPSSSLYIFTTLGARDITRSALLSALTDAVSRTDARYTPTPDRFTAKTLASLCHHRGADEDASTGGMRAGYSIYTAANNFEPKPLAEPKELPIAPSPPGSPERKRRKTIVEVKFGPEMETGKESEKAIESVSYTLHECFPWSTLPAEDETWSEPEEEGEMESEVEDATRRLPNRKRNWRPKVVIGFEGTDVFGGLRELAEEGRGVDVEKVRSWGTGEAGVTSGVVVGGRVYGRKSEIETAVRKEAKALANDAGGRKKVAGKGQGKERGKGKRKAAAF